MQTPMPQSAVLELTGADAIAFAQAQFMNDVTALPDRGWQWNGWLTPRGRVVAFFACYRLDAQTLLLWVPAGGADVFASQLRRFVFRAKVKLDEASGWQPLARFGEPGKTNDADARLEFPADDDEPSRHLVLARRNIDVPEDAALIDRWRLADLRLGVPYISPGRANSDQFVPQWLSLERLHAFNLKKGCYPGQEIVARMHYLGQSKRMAFMLAGEGDPPADMTRVSNQAGGTAGEVVWASAGNHAWLALAVLAKDQAPEGLHIDGCGIVQRHSLSERPFAPPH